MSFRECIVNGLNEGKLTPAQADQAQRIYADQLEDLQKTLPPGDAEKEAARRTFAMLDGEAALKKRRMALTAKVAARNRKDMLEHVNLKGEIDPAASLAAFVEWDQTAKFSSLRYREEAIIGQAESKMGQVILDFHRGLFGGQRNKADLDDLIREAFGEDSGSAGAKAAAKMWGEAAEYLRARFNAAGGAIGKRDDWGLPTFHDRTILKKMSYEQWRDELVLPRIDPGQMIDDLTGAPLTQGRLELALKDMYEAIVSENWSRRDPKMVIQATSWANKHGHERFFKWKNADAWREYQELAGNPNAFEAMTDHIKRMAKDIAAMEILGPNPRAMLTYMEQVAEKHHKTKKGSKDPTADIDRARTMFNIWTGETDVPANELMAHSFTTTRNTLIGAHLGSTFLASITDLSYSAAARAFNGMSQTGLLRDSIKLMSPGDRGDQLIAIQSGLVADHLTARSGAAQRFNVDNGDGEIMARMGEGPFSMRNWARWTGQVADSVLRVSGLSQWTQAGRWAFRQEFQRMLYRNMDKSMDALDPAVSRSLARHGISSGMWDDMRKSARFDEPGKMILTPDRIMEIPGLSLERRQYLADRTLEMIFAETEFAIPSSTIRGRAVWLNNNKSGTPTGEIMRSVGMLKSFPTTVSLINSRRFLQIKRDGQDGAGAYGRKMAGIYMTRLVAGATLTGALSLQLYEISRGRDPRNMGDKRFWGQAMLRGGGMGIFGDFLASETNRFGQSFGETIVGPVGGAIGDAINLTFNNARDVATGEDPELGRDLTDVMRRYVPGSSIWYLRMFYERLLVDQLQLMVDPGAADRMRRRVRSRQRDYDQDYYWAPGMTSPDRPPDLAEAFGDR